MRSVEKASTFLRHTTAFAAQALLDTIDSELAQAPQHAHQVPVTSPAKSFKGTLDVEVTATIMLPKSRARVVLRSNSAVHYVLAEVAEDEPMDNADAWVSDEKELMDKFGLEAPTRGISVEDLLTSHDFDCQSSAEDKLAEQVVAEATQRGIVAEELCGSHDLDGPSSDEEKLSEQFEADAAVCGKSVDET